MLIQIWIYNLINSKKVNSLRNIFKEKNRIKWWKKGNKKKLDRE